MREDAEFVRLLRQVGLVSIRYQAYIGGYEDFSALLAEVVKLQEMIIYEYPALRSMLADSIGRDAAVRDKNHTSGSTDTDDGRRLGGIGQDNSKKCP